MLVIWALYFHLHWGGCKQLDSGIAVNHLPNQIIISVCCQTTQDWELYHPHPLPLHALSVMYSLSHTNSSHLSLLCVHHVYIEERNGLVSVCCAFRRRMVKEIAPVFPLSSILQVTAWVPFWILFSLDLSSQLPLRLNKLLNLPPLPLSPVHLCLDSPLPSSLSHSHRFWVSVLPWPWGACFNPNSSNMYFSNLLMF